MIEARYLSPAGAHFVRDGSNSESMQPDGAMIGLQRAITPCGRVIENPDHLAGSAGG